MAYDRFKWKVAPNAHPGNTVEGKGYRFTLITPRLIRLEHFGDGSAEDRASQSVFYRDLGAVDHDAKREDGVLTLCTAELVLRYKEGEPFSRDSLSVRLVNEPGSTWYYGEDFEDLGGTARTLDVTDGALPLGRGVCSRFGFSVLDDTDTMVLGEDGWIETRSEGSLDLYFFGYGYDYRAAVSDYFRITGAPPLLPAYALGNWWSRYHKYTAEEYTALMDRFKEEDVPFSVGVIDMDWHIVNISEELRETEEGFESGWTGYTWNEELFPDYKAFLAELKARGLRTALNLHPAQGVRRHEAMYERAAVAAGIDPKSGRRIPLNVLSPKAMADYFDILHHPYEEDGVDFWWMDWQQGTDYWWIHERNVGGVLADPRERLDPLWMLNHLHILDISRNGKRPMFFSRFAGAGSHRYPVGFSGDTRVSWDALEFQPYFTATASNIGYCWWSHDIGGHMHGYRDDCLMTRWIQLGVFSPINRLHSTSNRFQLKEAWHYGGEAGEAIRKWLRLRHRLFPYIYTMNYRCHKELAPLVEPMYYSYPKCSAAYEVKNQFMFGSELMVCPITEPNGAADGLGRAEAWLPAGDLFDLETGLHYHSKLSRRTELFRDIHSYPVLAKAGAIVPLCIHRERDNVPACGKDLEILVFPCADGAFTLYEDGGEGQDYKEGAFALTDMRLEWGDSARFVLSGARGDLSLLPKERRYTLSFRGFHRCVGAAVTVGGKSAEASSHYNHGQNTLTVELTAPVSEDIEVIISGDRLVHDNSDVYERIYALLVKANITFELKNHYYNTACKEEPDLHEKIFRLGNSSPESYHTVKAIRELLTLTKDEFED